MAWMTGDLLDCCLALGTLMVLLFVWRWAVAMDQQRGKRRRQREFHTRFHETIGQHQPRRKPRQHFRL